MILEHLAARPRSREARSVRSRLSSLHADGLLDSSRRHGVTTWELTSAATVRLRELRAAGRLPALPESPQHHAWRNARALAAQEIERFRGCLHERVEEATRLLGEAPPPSSDAWFELGEDLQRACWRLGSASHCLHEWAEPLDERADLDVRLEAGEDRLDPEERALRAARRMGRRNVRLWRAGPRG
jgi:hypothetical protein